MRILDPIRSSPETLKLSLNLYTRGSDLKARRKWRLYADNNIEREIIQYLMGEAAFDVLAVGEDPTLRHRDDEFHYQKARQLGRYLLTHDDDFWNDRRFPWVPRRA